MLTTEQKKQFSDILEELGKSLDISETQFNIAVQSYNAVAEQLSKEGSLLASYKPEIRPQGSFLLGTMIKPINEEDDLDIDLICELHGKNDYWTQKHLKDNVGNQLKSNDRYKYQIKLKNGRRCWTLYYRESSDDPNDRYHLDVLPSIVDSNYVRLFSEAYSNISGEIDNLAIRITDKERDDYPTETNHLVWLKSNPIGYGKWFFNQAEVSTRKMMLFSEAVQPVPKYQEEKLPLQRVVQILKRHRDMMFNGDEHKPISIIITTLASRAYNKENDIIKALINVVNTMEVHIKEKYSPEHGRNIKWISNPVNPEENFADKWPDYPIKEENFKEWLKQVKLDVQNITEKRGLQLIQESMVKPFGDKLIAKTFSSYGDKYLQKRESGTLKMAAGTGMLGLSGRTPVTKHTNFGKNE